MRARFTGGRTAHTTPYDLNDAYLSWLGDIVGGEHHRRLLAHLHEIEFTHFVPNDMNRALDGFGLRETFCEPYHNKEFEAYRDILRGPCSFLEMLVALAIRIEDDIMHDEEFGDRTPVWFWEMLGNIDLDVYTDDRFRDRDILEIDHKVDIVLSRRYKKDGSGSLFPRKVSHKDQRNVEIWMQMSGYFDENYF